MDPLERIRSVIDDFAGYAEAEQRRLADEQIRGFVGEILAELPAVEVDGLTGDERVFYDRVLLRCEFVNQDVFRVFDRDPRPDRIAATLQADIEVIDVACTLRSDDGARATGVLEMLSIAFDKRDAAMRLE